MTTTTINGVFEGSLAYTARLPCLKTETLPVIETVEVSLADLRITLYDDHGNEIMDGNRPEIPPRSCNFDVRGPGIESWRVRQVIFPDLDYRSNGRAVVKVEMVVFEDMEKARKVAKEAGWLEGRPVPEGIKRNPRKLRMSGGEG